MVIDLMLEDIKGSGFVESITKNRSRYIRECVMYYFTTIGILALMCVGAHITGETHVPYLHMMFVFCTLLYERSIH